MGPLLVSCKLMAMRYKNVLLTVANVIKTRQKSNFNLVYFIGI